MKKWVLLATMLVGAAAPLWAEQEASGGDVHGRLLTLDTHLDTPVHFARQGWDFGAEHSRDNDIAQVDLGRMDKGALDGGFFVIYTRQGPVTAEGFAKARADALRRADEIAGTLAKFPERIGLATRAGDAARFDRAGKRFAYISIENSYPLGGDLSLLSEFYRRGVRMAGPVHSRNNQFADSATDSPKWNGLSPLGRRWVAEMNRLGMIIDASHASDTAFDQMLALSKTPLILSHSGSKALWDHRRNIDDDRIRRLAKTGGAICVNSVFLGKRADSPEWDAISKRADQLAEMTPEEQARFVADRRALERVQPLEDADFDKYMAMVLHLIRMAGVDHVCFGADWDGGSAVRGMEDIGALPKVSARLLAAGYSETDLQKMWSGNVLRLLRGAEAAKGR